MSITSCSEAPIGGLPNSVMSAPAKKVRPSQRSTIAAIEPSAMPSFTPASSPSRTAAPSAFTGGEFEMMTSTSPWRSVRTGEVMSGFSSWSVRRGDQASAE